MQTLGLSGEGQRSDGRLKSIFWPTVQNAWDVDALGRQGFWICLIIAAFQLVVSLLARNPIMIATGTMSALAFVVGGMGVRQSNWPAAAMVFALFFVGLLYSLASGQFPGFLAIIAAAILLSNVRAAFLASEWKPVGEDEDRPMRFNETRQSSRPTSGESVARAADTLLCIVGGAAAAEPCRPGDRSSAAIWHGCRCWRGTLERNQGISIPLSLIRGRRARGPGNLSSAASSHTMHGFALAMKEARESKVDEGRG